MTAELDPFDLLTEGCDELVANPIDPIRLVIPPMFTAGLYLLAGDPKSGKSLLMQYLALCTAMGGDPWPGCTIEPGDVLYLAREGGKASFRDRMMKMLGDDATAPKRMRIAYTSGQLGAVLEAQVQRWLEQANDPRLVVIDTYAAVAPDLRGVSRQREEYATLAGLADVARNWPNTLLVVVHHTNQSTSVSNPMHRIEGSNGLTAATDGNAILSRGVAANRCGLLVQPRNASETDLVLERDPLTLRWSVVGNDERSLLSEGRQAVLAYLDEHPGGSKPADIAKGTGLTDESVRQFLSLMAKAGQVEKLGHGLYASPKQQAA